MKQINLFGQEFAPKVEEQKYSSKIEAPIYEPKNKKPDVFELVDRKTYYKLMKDIDKSSCGQYEKVFLKIAAARHNVFNYEKIADYYAHSNHEMQDLMERSGLVIIDFNKAIQYGYIKVCEEIRNQYLEEYGE